MKYFKLPIYALAAALMTAPTLANAWWWHWDDDDDDDVEIPFEEARLFLELNDTDGDLGIHGKIDGDEWKRLEIEDKYDRRMLNVRARGRLRQQGLTELFFESAEPTFDELDPVKFFKRFPEGEYDIEGVTLDGDERESEVWLSHIIPAAPEATAEGTSGSVDACTCDPEELEGEETCPAVTAIIADATDGVTIAWPAVTMSHARKHATDDKIPLGTEGPEDISDHVRYYEVVAEIDESPFKATAIIPPAEEGEVNAWEVPGDFFELAEEGKQANGEECDGVADCYAQYKYEVLVRTNVFRCEDDACEEGEFVFLDEDEEENLAGNKSAIESCFLVPIEYEDDIDD